MPNKHHEARREALKDLLSTSPAATQQSLVSTLKAAGYTATQSSVSRDLRELGAIKTRNGYEIQTSAPADDAIVEAVSALIRSVQSAGPNLTVIKTGVGAAQRVALALDRSDWPEVVGNIGGDDTVFVATRSATDQRRLAHRLTQSASRPSERISS